MRAVSSSLLVLCLWSGCGLIMIGGPVEEQDLSSQDDAEENLKAIRAMLVDQASRSSRSEEKPSGISSPPSPSEATPSLSEPAAGPRPLSSSSSSVGQADAPAKLPWSPTAPDRSTAPDRPVPAYTVPAPVGPDYSGSIRCTPDGMGGQRCAGK